MRHFFTAGVSILPFLFMSEAAVAQSGCMQVTGLVHDSTAAIIRGASVQIDGGPSTLSDSSGKFRTPCVSAGRHSLHIFFEGFADLSVAVKTPHVNDLDLTLRLREVKSTVEVKAEDDVQAEVSPTATGSAQTILGKRLQSLADDPDDLLKELQQMAAAAGGKPSGATISVDGFQSDTNRGILPPKSSIAYIKINPDLFSAEYRDPPFGGGSIQVFTKPGQSTFHGSVYGTSSNSWLNARDPFTTSKAPVGKQRFGFGLTGPIRRGSDFNVDVDHRSIANVAAVNAIGLDRLGNQTPLRQTVSSPQSLWYGLGKVDWQLGPKNSIAITFNAWHNHQENAGAGGTTLPDAAWEAREYDNHLNLNEVFTPSLKLLNQARLSIQLDGLDQTPNSFAPRVQVAGAFISGGSINGAMRDHEIDLELDDNLIWSSQKHLIKFGLQSEYLRERFHYTSNLNGTWLFSGGAAPQLGASHQPTANVTTIGGAEQYVRALNGWAGGAPTQFSEVVGEPTLNTTQYRETLFIQDDWSVRPRLHLALGLRYYTQSKPVVRNNLNPRFGVSWSPDRNSTWTLHAHAGLFSGRFTAHTYAQLVAMDGRDRISYLVYSPSCPGAFDSRICNAFSGATPLQSIRTIEPHMPNSLYSIENVGFSHSFGKGWTVSADIDVQQMWHLTRSENINAPTTGQPLGPRPLEQNINILQWQANGRGYGNIIFLGLANHQTKHIQFSASSVRQGFLDNTDGDPFTSPQTTGLNVGEYARRTGNALWSFLGSATEKLPWAFQLSENLTAQQGRPFNVTTGLDNNGDGNFNDRPYLSQAGTKICSPSFPGYCAYKTSYGLLSTTGVGPTLARNAGLLPWTLYLDTNLQRTFKLTQDLQATHLQTLTIDLRTSNVLNHVNVTAIGNVVGSPLFGEPYSADNGRRVEVGLRYNLE